MAVRRAVKPGELTGITGRQRQRRHEGVKGERRLEPEPALRARMRELYGYWRRRHGAAGAGAEGPGPGPMHARALIENVI